VLWGIALRSPKKLANREPHFCYFFDKQMLQILSKRVDPKMGLATCKNVGISQSFTRGMLRFFRFSVNFFLSRTAPSRRQLKGEVSNSIFSHGKKIKIKKRGILVMKKVHCNFHPVHRTLHTAHCTLRSVQCAVCSVQCAVCSVQCAPCTVHCALCTVHCAVCSVQCAVCSVQCAVCSVHCAVCSVQ
jgi:hypothetical protein